MSRIRANRITNQNADGAPVFPNGIVVTGVVTATTLNPSVGGDLSISDKIIHTGDTNTALRFPAADTITAETSGSERLRITSGGSIGIGTDNPQQDVHILRSQLSRVRIESTSTAYNSDVIFQNPDGLLGVVGYNATLDSINIDSRGGTNGVTVTRTGVEKVRITGDGKVGINSAIPQATLEIHDIGSTGPCLLLHGGSTTEGDIVTIDGEALGFGHWNSQTTTYTERFRINSSGHALPGANNQYDLGSTSLRWANVYTNDLHLSNQGTTNSVDNTWGDFTIQEGESDLFLINNRNGKKYKFNLTEVS